MNSNGGNQHRLTFSSGEIEDTQPGWSRDGSKIAFVSTRDSTLETWQETDDDGNVINRSKWHVNKEIYLMNVDGSGQTRLTNELANDDSPGWSPDGSKIVFRSDRERDWSDPSAQVWTMNADGSSQTNLSNTPNGDYSASWASASANQSPVANAGGPYNGVTAQSISFNGGSSFDPDGSITSYAWNFGDGGTGSGVAPTHAYTTLGTYNVSLVVTDNNGATASAAATATITQANQPPIANTGGSYSAATAQSITFNGSGSSDPDGTIATYSWSFGDGGTGSGVTPIHSYAAAGTYNVTLTVTDNQGSQASATTTASVTTATADFFTQNFIQVALDRTPNPDEVNYWEDIFRAAYAHQQGSMMIAVREMARTVFESAEYAGRGRDNHWYVYDLYETYLMRYPDAPGWGFWEGQCNAYGREQVRRAFDECGEFAGKVSAIHPTGSVSSGVYSLQSSRVNPENQPGNQLLARDAEWSGSLLSLPGRAGLDLGLGLSYSSAVWTRSGPYAYFDEDKGTLSPGFRLGFPTVQEVFFDAQVGANVRVLVTGSGQRVELRQIGTTNVYEAADSSYLQLIDYGNTLTVRSTDGTQMSYAKLQDEWRCTQIEDRNGNLISIVNDWRGDIQNITDTLGRVITFNYDANANLVSITQAGRTEPWVTFGWGTTRMHPIAGASVVGTHDNEDIPVLSFVGLPDGSYYRFIYTTTGSGQVSRVTHYASDSDPQHDTHELAHTVFNYLAADDSTRLSSTQVAAENWTGINELPAEVVTEFGIEGAAHTLKVMGDPNSTVYKESYGAGWQRGLVVSTEVRAGGATEKTTTTSWTKDDNTSNNFATNPRVIRTDIIDSAQHRTRTTIDYGAYAQYGLPNVVSESSVVNGVMTELRRSYTDYKLTQPYLERPIIGLVSKVRIYDPLTSQWQTKVTYDYDAPANIQAEATDAIQHDQVLDNTFVVRGNVTSVSRWDTSDIDNGAKALTTQITYNAAGSVLSSSDPLGHTTSVSYADQFAANGITMDQPRSFATWAYPTKVTDGDGYSSRIRYRYDFGAPTWKQTPKPNETTIASSIPGPERLLEYDSVTSRLQRVTSLTNGAYTRYVYGSNYVRTLSTVNNVADEAYSAQIFDGLGRVIASVHNHPTLNGGGYSAVVTVFDRFGRAIRQSNPTDTSTAGQQWPATGDDDPQSGGHGWVYTQQTYDWKGRPLIRTNPSITGNPNETTAKEARYSVCGCAGSEMVTLEDEVGRTQKVYSDALGRQWKTEILDFDSTIYSTSVSVYNGRDQVIRVKQYAGVAPLEASSTYADAFCPTGSCQESRMEYDAYGRLITQHEPEQQIDPNNSSSTDHTSWDYNNDNTIQKVTDARGASATYTYNSNRHLVNLITYSTPPGSTPSGIAPTTNVSFEYDAVGNRKLMTDGLGSKSYTYNQLSQLISETRTLTNVGTFPLSYDYNLAGELKTVSDPWGAVVNYGFDQSGRMDNVSGSGYGTATQFLSNLRYRAWGTLKSETYGNGFTESAAYDSRLQMTSFEVRQGDNQLAMSRTNQYYADGELRYSHDALDERFDRGAAYDNTARVVQTYSGSEARDFINGVTGSLPTGPYRQSYQYNAFDQVTQQANRIWSDAPTTTINNFVNNRQQGWVYDANGRVLIADNTSISRDVNSQIVAEANGSATRANKFDGDGRLAWTSLTRPNFRGIMVTSARYYLSSTVLGGLAVAELNSSGQKTVGTVYAAGRKIAQAVGNYVTFAHKDPVTGSRGDSTPEGTYGRRSEYDADGVDIGFQDPTPIEGEVFQPAFLGAKFGPGSSCSNADPTCKSCYLDGLEGDCGRINWEGAQQCPDNDCGPRSIWNVSAQAFVGVLPLTTDPNTGLWGVSGTIDQYGRYPITIKDLDGNIISSSPGHWNKIGTLAVSFLLEPQNTGFDLDGIKRLVNQALGNSDCAGFMSRVLNAASSKSNPVLDGGNASKIFTDFLSQKHGGLTREKPEGSLGYGSPTGRIAKGNAKIFLIGGVANQTVTDAIGVIGELAHLAGSKESYTDQLLATIVHGIPEYAALSRMTTPHSNVFDLNYERKAEAAKNPNAGGWSSYFHDIQRQKCPVGN